MKKTILTTALVGLSAVGAQAAIVYSNDFSTTQTFVSHTNNGAYKVGSGNAGDLNSSGDFAYNSTRTASISVSNEQLVISQDGGNGVVWLLLDTETWSAGDYSVTFDVAATDGKNVSWDIFAGSGLDSFAGTGPDTNYLTVRTASAAPQVAVRNNLGSATATALDPLRTALDSTSDNSFTTTGQQSMAFTLTADHVGTAGDYFLMGWTTNNKGDWNMDNLVVSTAAVPEPSSTALLGLGGLALILRRRK